MARIALDLAAQAEDEDVDRAIEGVGMVAAQSLTVKTNEPVYRYFELAVVFPSWLFAFKAAGSPPKKSVVWAVVISILALLIDLYAVQFILFE